MPGFIELKDVRKIYRMGEVEIKAVDGINFSIERGEFVVIVGPSGAGKTTVLNILGGMDQATAGEVWVNDNNIAEYSAKALTKYRRDAIGFVFQFYNLVQNLTAKENVELAAQICKEPLDAELVLEEVGKIISRHSYPAGSSSASQLQELWLRIRSCYCVMNRRVHWIIRQESRY